MKISFLSICLAAALLCGCGIKPADVDPPPGVAKDRFPQTYPAQ